ncbi:MAG: ABC transporter permease [Alphaproteobacteria bacterium]|nr:ABC transporter permease [Alphaproteobacteria bacterium]
MESAHLDATPPIHGVNWIGLFTIIRRETARLMRVPLQAFVAPWISALLFIFIFGYVVGQRIALIAGHRYIEFVLPGIVMLNVVNAAFLQSSSQVYFARFMRYVEETLVSPLTYAEMIAGVIAVVIMRALVTAVGILLLALVFGATRITDFGAFLFWIMMVSIVFGLVGQIVGLWADNFEQLTILNIFFITPLSFVGGVFNTVSMLPPWLRWMAWANPFFYFINGLRQSMIGFTEAPEGLGASVTLALAVVLFLVVWRLYARGFGLRE